MGFSAYILETLNRYGKVDLGPLGSFNLNYTPARWHLSRQNFEPPSSQLSWLPPDESITTEVHYSSLAVVIARMHDIPFEQASDFCKNQIEICNRVLHEDDLDLLPLGKIIRNKEGLASGFIKYHSLDPTLKFEVVRLGKLNPVQKKEANFQWWLVIVSALLLGALFFVVNKIIEIKNTTAANSLQHNLTTFPSKTAIMNTNMAPLIADSSLIRKSVADSIKRLPNASAIVITGTFCQKANADKMKKLIADEGYTTYEEDLKNGCIRLGIQVTIDAMFEEKLQSIRSKIEPSAWILDR